MEAKLNRLMAAGNYCSSLRELEATAFQVLELAPYDQVAYHALLVTSIIRQDLKMIYLMSKVGLRALFLQRIYDYSGPESVRAKFEFWQSDVFNPARERAGTELVLDFIDCDGQKVPQRMPTTLLALDVPVEILKMLASRKMRADFKQLRALNDDRFLDRIHHLIDQVVEAIRRPAAAGEPIRLDLAQAPDRGHGVLELDLSDVDIFGYPGETEFKLRRANSLWLTYYTDGDRRKSLLLPEGNYYLMVDKKVRKVFKIVPEGNVPVEVAAR